MRAIEVGEDRLLRVVERPSPTPGPGQVAIDVACCGICGSDLHFRDVPALFPPGTVPGHEFSGSIAAVGEEVAGWNAGDRVCVLPFAQCGECAACTLGHRAGVRHRDRTRRRSGNRAPGRLRGARGGRCAHVVRAAGRRGRPGRHARRADGGRGPRRGAGQAGARRGARGHRRRADRPSDRSGRARSGSSRSCSSRAIRREGSAP